MPNSPRTVKVFTDGCAKGNPGPAGAGFVIEDIQGEAIEEGSVPLGSATNNEAEYRALLLAMESCVKRRLKAAYFYTDSELMANQINGFYRIRSARLQRLFDRVDKLREKFDSFQIVHVPRKMNGRADELSNLALKQTRDGAREA